MLKYRCNCNSPFVQFLLEHNKRQSKEYTSPAAEVARKLYRAKHPTEIIVLKCMDGRLHLPLMTKLPLGIAQPFRTIGGKFELGEPFFGQLLQDSLGFSIDHGRNCLILATYHFSKGSKQRGCKGFNYDTIAAREAAGNLTKETNRLCGQSSIYAVHIGIETDEDALIIHNGAGRTWELANEIASTPQNELIAHLHSLFPDMPDGVLADFLPLIQGNLAHIADVRRTGRGAVDCDHKEKMVGVGRGFDWLHLHNKALIIGPYSKNMEEPIIAAGGILLDNLTRDSIPREEGVVLMASALYRKRYGFEEGFARKKAEYLGGLAYRALERGVPDIIPHLSVLIGVVDPDTREFSQNE